MTLDSFQTRLVRTRSELQSVLAEARKRGCTIGLVPTMGALHDGHLSLIEAAQRDCDLTIVSIFVNPKQFGPDEDLKAYPRTTDNDLKKLHALRVSCAFVPSEAEIFPPDFSTLVQPPRVAATLEGKCRPGHFAGVATVVLKLFLLIPADIAYFGAKDFQQSLVIRQLVRDLNVPITIRVCPIVRDSDGLALSSRNRYLSADERLQALALPQSLNIARELVAAGQRQSAQLTSRIEQELTSAGITRIDYVAIRDAESLDEITCIDRPARLLLAVRIGDTRLIDNCSLG